MGIDIRLPSITATTEREQLQQMKSYLFQLAEQLQWALQNVDTSNHTVAVAPTAKSLTSSAQTPVSAETTFGSLKALIIKSADIVDAYYEEINKRLVGMYVAESDFGTFQEQTSLDIAANSENIKLAYGNIQEIRTGVDLSLNELLGDIGGIDTKVENGLGTINSYLLDVKANIKVGHLNKDRADETPIYGVEVGQTNTINGEEKFNKFARFTADRLSFYDRNGIEVAYISDYKLYITHAEVTGALKIGGYLVDTTNGLTFRWVGRG